MCHALEPSSPIEANLQMKPLYDIHVQALIPFRDLRASHSFIGFPWLSIRQPAGGLQRAYGTCGVQTYPSFAKNL